MLPDPAVLLPFALAVVVIALTPGPDMAFFLGRALTQGRAAGLAAMAGATTGILVHTMLVALGLSALIVAAPTAFLALKVAGAALPRLARGPGDPPRLGADPARPPRARRSLAATWASGLAINLLNPKIVLFFMTFLPQFVRAGDPHAAAQLVTLGAPLHRHRALHHRADDPRRRPGRRDPAQPPPGRPRPRLALRQRLRRLRRPPAPRPRPLGRSAPQDATPPPPGGAAGICP